MLDNGLESMSKIINAVFNVDAQSVKGAGAAGGMGIASKVFLKGTLEAGIQLIKTLANFDNQIEGADWIITGEGKLDTQTFSGKTIQGVMASAKAKNIKVAAFCGAIDLDENCLNEFGIVYADAVMNYSKNLEDAMQNSYNYVKEISVKFASKNVT
jgi:glycerate kinase